MKASKGSREIYQGFGAQLFQGQLETFPHHPPLLVTVSES
jgi:hypothetical protein